MGGREVSSIDPVTTSGWYERTDGTIGKYVWREGRLALDCVVLGWDAVPSPEADLAANIPPELR